MNIDKFKHQHGDIMRSVTDLKVLVRAGIERNADDIARLIITISSTIKLHLAGEDKFLYPAMQASGNPELTRMGRHYQDEMGDIANAYLAFSREWNNGAKIRSNPEQFRSHANRVFRSLHERIQRENVEFYPAIEMHHGAMAA